MSTFYISFSKTGKNDLMEKTIQQQVLILFIKMAIFNEKKNTRHESRRERTLKNFKVSSRSEHLCCSSGQKCNLTTNGF